MKDWQARYWQIRAHRRKFRQPRERSFYDHIIAGFPPRPKGTLDATLYNTYLVLIMERKFLRYCFSPGDDDMESFRKRLS